MSEAIPIRLTGVGKMYKLFSSRSDNLLEALGLGRIIPWHTVRYREFWALRGVDLELRRGQRIGVIGRNGAGKSTLLKLITGNLAATEGSVEVEGDVQALLETGGGFHPDFTGSANIRAALVYQGLSRKEIEEAEGDIADFTELGEFLDQPLKAYSAGMQARLAFATATVLRPEVLIIDEILGAGDAYFLGKSSERMRQLAGSGASILLVSHSMPQVTQMCETALWLERGQIMMTGRSLEVVKAYEQFVRELEDERLRGRNERRLGGVTGRAALERPTSLFCRLVLDSTGRVDISEIKLWRQSRLVDHVSVGAPQDADPAHPAFVVLEGSDWSPPLGTNGTFFRRLARSEQKGSTKGTVHFSLFAPESSGGYELEITHRSESDTRLRLEAWTSDTVYDLGEILSHGGWSHVRVPISLDENTAGNGKLVHWPGEGSLSITDAQLFDGNAQPCAVFDVGSKLRLLVAFEPRLTATYRLLPTATIYRDDGINVTSQIGEWVTREFVAGKSYQAELSIDSLNLGNGTYVMSLAFYKVFDPMLIEPPVAYDWVDRSIEFSVVGTPPAIASQFIHPSKWIVR
jgi:lipopolysaccharide transport system ATP-binding protein